jgi:dephospho-CoA kinase
VIAGLTGGIGSGKTTVAAMLAERGAIVLDSDEIARRVVLPGSPVFAALRREFGACVVGRTGDLDRASLAALVFADAAKRRRLNEIVHPPILQALERQIAAYPPSAIVVVVAPLLFESQFDAQCDVRIAVSAPAALRIRRVMARDALSEDAAAARLAAQLSDAEYERRADIVVRNEGDLAALRVQVNSAWLALLARAKAAP